MYKIIPVYLVDLGKVRKKSNLLKNYFISTVSYLSLAILFGILNYLNFDNEVTRP